MRPLIELFPARDHPKLLIGLEVTDDAAVYQINDDLAIIQTLDFFTPIIDDPYEYGAIAAANAMSDVYAMGGEVALALNIAAFPPDLPHEIIAQILRGGAEKVAEAGGVIAGGHTIDDEEPKYGLSVMGFVHPQSLTTKAGVRPGDALILTKPLGVGIITTAAKGDVAKPAHLRRAVETMTLLNRQAAHLMREAGCRAATDITGFGFLGHAYEMSEKSGVTLRFFLKRLPFLEGAMEYADESLFPGGACRNRDCYAPHVKFDPSIPEEVQMLLFTPETSGGLLIAISPHKLEELKARFTATGQSYWVVGEAMGERKGIEIR